MTFLAGTGNQPFSSRVGIEMTFLLHGDDFFGRQDKPTMEKGESKMNQSDWRHKTSIFFSLL